MKVKIFGTQVTKFRVDKWTERLVKVTKFDEVTKCGNDSDENRGRKVKE